MCYFRGNNAESLSNVYTSEPANATNKTRKLEENGRRQPAGRHTKRQMQSRIRCLHRLTECNEPTPALLLVILVLLVCLITISISISIIIITIIVIIICYYHYQVPGEVVLQPGGEDGDLAQREDAEPRGRQKSSLVIAIVSPFLK